MKMKPFRILCHALTMVRRNLRAYAALSVTIILSFSILLGFMGYMDTKHYNSYKGLLSKDPSLLKVSSASLSAARAALLQDRAAEYGTTHSLQYLSVNHWLQTDGWTLATGESLTSDFRVQANAIPRETWFLEDTGTGMSLLGTYSVTWLDDREVSNVTLEPGEILIDEQLFKALGLNQGNNTLKLTFSGGDLFFERTFTVVGTVPSTYPLELELYEIPNTGEQAARLKDNKLKQYTSVIFFSLQDFNPTVFGGSWYRNLIFYSDQPTSVKQMIKTLEPDLSVLSVYEMQENAFEVIRTEKATKSVIAILLLLILGINLYSSFQNALNERKFEIGVKRAVGASAFSIVRQFFYESMLVMLINIAVTVALVVDLGLVLKLYREATAIGDTYANLAETNYILYITGESVAMFAVCALVLTVVFSFIFAYKATRVQIVDYLKAE